MGEALVFARGFGILKAGEVLAFPGSISESSAKRLSGSADELIRGISVVMDDLVGSAIETRTAAEFAATRLEVFPKYLEAVLALSSMISILVPKQIIERLNREFFCQLEADLREHGLTAFGAAVRDQAIFTVWTLRKISDFMSQVAVAVHDKKCDDKQEIEMLHECLYYAVRTRFHVHCLISCMTRRSNIHPDVMESMIDGLRSVVNAYGLAKRVLDVVAPSNTEAPVFTEWDEEDEALIREASFDMVSEPA